MKHIIIIALATTLFLGCKKTESPSPAQHDYLIYLWAQGFEVSGDLFVNNHFEGTIKTPDFGGYDTLIIAYQNPSPRYTYIQMDSSKNKSGAILLKYYVDDSLVYNDTFIVKDQFTGLTKEYYIENKGK